MARKLFLLSNFLIAFKKLLIYIQELRSSFLININSTLAPGESFKYKISGILWYYMMA